MVPLLASRQVWQELTLPIPLRRCYHSLGPELELVQEQLVQASSAILPVLPSQTHPNRRHHHHHRPSMQALPLPLLLLSLHHQWPYRSRTSLHQAARHPSCHRHQPYPQPQQLTTNPHRRHWPLHPVGPYHHQLQVLVRAPKRRSRTCSHQAVRHLTYHQQLLTDPPHHWRRRLAGPRRHRLQGLLWARLHHHPLHPGRRHPNLLQFLRRLLVSPPLVALGRAQHR